MSVFSVGDATITRVEETNLPTYPARDIFPEFTDAHVAEHKSWLAPQASEPSRNRAIANSSMGFLPSTSANRPYNAITTVAVSR